MKELLLRKYMIPISITKNTASRISTFDQNNIAFGKIYTDHMFVCDYEDGTWKNARIQPFEAFQLNPATSALHYGQAIFEGMKAFSNEKGEISLFRPRDNARRLNVSAERMMMPSFPEDVFMEGLTKLIEIDSKWVPNVPNSALYIRPYMFATDAYIGVKPSDSYTFCIFCCPVGPYYNKALKVKIEQDYSRAVRGGTGYAKCAGNYAAALKPTALAQKEGFDQILWTDAIEHKYIEETGTTNIFLVFNGKIVTPEKSDTLLQGITRDSVIQISKDMGLNVEERKISVDELVEAQKNGTLDEIFISGTAAAILNIDEFGFKGERFAVSADGPNKISARIKQHLLKIREGSINDMHEWRLTITHSSD